MSPKLDIIVKLIADSGSTKTHWALVTRSGQRSDFFTEGLNPFHRSEEDIRRVLSDVLVPQLGKFLWVGPIDEIAFYGAGCTPEKSLIIKDILLDVFGNDGLSRANALNDGMMSSGLTVTVQSDMIGAAKALLGRETGVACILGTGSASCLWDGEKITKQVPSLGYILGDEGSGAVLGRTLAGDALKGLMGESLRLQFADWILKNDELSREQSSLNDELMISRAQAHIIDKVYRQPMANRYLASLSKFCAENRGEKETEALLKKHFASFRDRVIDQYAAGKDGLIISFVGSIAWYYRDILEEVLAEKGYRVGRILQDPIDGLVDS